MRLEERLKGHFVKLIFHLIPLVQQETTVARQSAQAC